MQHPIDEGLVDGLEGLLQGEFLSLLWGNVIEYHVGLAE
jgi:hypothetical protein